MGFNKNCSILWLCPNTLSSLHTLLPCSLWKKHSTGTTSQSLSCLKKQGAQTPPSAEGYQASLDEVMAYKDGKEVLNRSPPHHLSFQNLTLLPLPMAKAMLPLKISQSFLMVFHNPTSYLSLTSWERHPPSSSLYLPLMTCFQKASLFYAKTITPFTWGPCCAMTYS